MKSLFKNTMKLFVAVSTINVSTLANSQLNVDNNTNNQSNLMTIVKCIQHADRVVGSAFMLPPGWQSQCNTEYNLIDGFLWSDPIFKATHPNNNIQLYNEKNLHFYYNKQLRDQTISSKSLNGIDISIFGPEFARSLNTNTQEHIKIYDATYPKAIDLVDFASNRSHELNQLQGYQVYHISRDPIVNSIRGLIKNNNIAINTVTIIAHQINNANNIKMIKLVQFIVHIDRADHYSWHLASVIATGNRNDEAHMSKLINLVINTQQENPRFTRMLGQVNANMAKQNMKTFTNISNINAKANAEISDIYNNIYKNTNASFDRIQSKWVDGMLEVESYVNPYDGKEVKMPMHNKYYFTNNLDDYIGTNNPLINPNTNLNFLYNWNKLEKF